MNLQNYNENSIKTLAPREAVRENYAMYIGDNTSRGFHHLLTEIVANAMDEAASGFGNIIKVEIDTKQNKASVIDRGRGIPFRMNSEGKYAIKEMCTSLHSGGKFASAGNYKSSLGLHGLGATVTNALSKMFRIEVAREDGNCILEYRDGEETIFSIEDKRNKITGSTVSFIPDPEIFGNTKWNRETIEEELQLHALLNNNLTFILVWDGKEVAKFLYTNGIREMLNIKFGDAKPLTDIISHKVILNKDTASECSVELALRYSTEGTEKVYAFTNGGYNPDLGTHVTGFRSAWTSKINQLAREHELLKMSDENLEGTIIRRGLCLVLSIKMSERPMFAEQTKLKLTSPSARGYVSQAVGTMTIPKKDLEAIVNKILLEKKAEEAAQRKRDAIKAISAGGKNINVLKEVSEKFSDATSKTGERELFIVEGKSAAGSAKEARDSRLQAIYPLRGKPLNTLTKGIEDIIKNQEIKDILAILGCGVEDKFNLKNLRYDKIILLSDADVK